MLHDRAVGYLRPPTRDQIAAYAARHFLSPTPEELDALHAAVAGSLDNFNRIEELDETVIRLQSQERDPGRPPRPDEDPLMPLSGSAPCGEHPKAHLWGRPSASKTA
jgi:hypothetical protein